MPHLFLTFRQWAAQPFPSDGVSFTEHEVSLLLIPAVCGPLCLCSGDFVFENIGLLVFDSGEAVLVLLLFLWSCAPSPFHCSSEHIELGQHPK